MNRRIINEILTTYLPSVFILAIVYATNFFKPFFFEAVVTVNLTSQLVLTTLFISVSKSLPPTAYVKMIAVWLIFSQLIPFAQLKCETITNVTFDVNVTIVITNCVTSCTKNQPSTLFLYNCPQKPLTQRPWPSVTLSKMLICSLFTPLQTSLTRLVAKLAC